MLSVAEIKRFIDDDITSERKRFAGIGQRYYEGKHDILNYQMFYFNGDGNLVKDEYRSNIKISHPFFTLLADQHAAYMLSFKENPIRAKQNVEGLQEKLDLYFNDKFWEEILEAARGAYVKGFDYIYGFKGKDNRLEFQQADGMGVVEVRAKDTDDGCEYIIYWYIDRIDKGKKLIKRIQVWSETETQYFVQVGNGKIDVDKSVEVNPRPHVIYTDEKTGKRMGYSLGYIPFWRLDNNKKQISGIAPIKSLIDDYDLHACSLSNNLKDFDTPIHLISGFQGDNLDELQMNLKTKKVVGVDAEGGIDIKTVEIPYQARKEKLDLDEKAIYKFGMGTNTAALKDSNATTNIGIKAAFYDLDLKATEKTKKLCSLLDEIIPVVLAEINAEEGTGYQRKDVEYIFERSTMTNETENIANEKTKAEIEQIKVNTILNVAANVGDEQTLKAICDVMDWDFEELQGQIEMLQEERAAANAKKTLEGVVIDDEGKHKDIPEGDE